MEQFVGNHTQFDADSDAIPDTYEREVAGGLSALGAQDSDLDGVLDVIEFAAGSDPRDGRSIPGGQMETASVGRQSFATMSASYLLGLVSMLNFRLISSSGGQVYRGDDSFECKGIGSRSEGV
ncbi:hypothetical protein [Rubritalea tangerina]|uniref:hypothetical protein n=1 Tax=Rubritalea tangerina TaxID=430798 RepID=UPI003610248D